MVAFCGRILPLGKWNLEMSWRKCPGVHKGYARRGCGGGGEVS